MTCKLDQGFPPPPPAQTFSKVNHVRVTSQRAQWHSVPPSSRLTILLLNISPRPFLPRRTDHSPDSCSFDTFDDKLCLAFCDCHAGSSMRWNAVHQCPPTT